MQYTSTPPVPVIQPIKHSIFNIAGGARLDTGYWGTMGYWDTLYLILEYYGILDTRVLWDIGILYT